MKRHETVAKAKTVGDFEKVIKHRANVGYLTEYEKQLAKGIARSAAKRAIQLGVKAALKALL